MSIIEKVFKYEENEISVIKCRDDTWFKGTDVARSLGYEKTRNAILRHVEDEDKTTLEELRRGGGARFRAPLNMDRLVRLS